MYIFATDGAHRNKGHFCHASSDILHNIYRFISVNDSVEEGGVNIDANVVFGVYSLVTHIHNFGLKLHFANILSARVVVMQSWLKSFLELTKLLNQT